MSDVTGATPSAAGSSPASSTATAGSTSGESTPASATATPTESPESAVAPSTPVASEPGPVPYGRFKEVNEQLRAAKDFRDQYGWAEQFKQDPYAFVDQWMDQLSAHPEHSPKLLAKAARMLNARRGQSPPAAEMPKPDVPIQDQHGNITGYTYSDKQLQLRDEFMWQQRQAALDERLGPLEKRAKAQEQAEQLHALQQQSWQQATDTLTELRQNPYFKEHEAKVKQALAAHDEWGDNIHAAFNHVLVTEILPTLSRTEQRKVVESLQQKAGASTVGPHGAGAATPKKFKNFAEAAEYYSAHPDEAEAAAHR